MPLTNKTTPVTAKIAVITVSHHAGAVVGGGLVVVVEVDVYVLVYVDEPLVNVVVCVWLVNEVWLVVV